MDKQNQSHDSVQFALGLEGSLLYQFGFKTGLLKKPLLQYKYRTPIICLFAWLPLFILSLFSGVAFSGAEVPFIYDIDTHIRFLISLSLLISADIITNKTLERIVRQFINCNVIAPNDRKKFASFIASAMRMSNSILVEIVIIFFVVMAGLWISKNFFSFGVSTWYESITDHQTKLTPAGYWYAFISLPLFQFFLLRWYYRIAIWYRFLWQVSRLPLQLNSLHPDQAGGIGFLANSMYSFLPILLAHSVLLSGIIFNHILNEGATLAQFQYEIASFMVFLIILPFIPLLFFTISLIKTKQIGTLEYAVAASNYVNNFRQKWIENPIKNKESLLGTPDIQSLSDLANSFQISAHMRITPSNRNIVLSIIILTALPLLPLVLTIIPLEKIMYQIMGFMFK